GGKRGGLERGGGAVRLCRICLARGPTAGRRRGPAWQGAPGRRGAGAGVWAARSADPGARTLDEGAGRRGPGGGTEFGGVTGLPGARPGGAGARQHRGAGGPDESSGPDGPEGCDGVALVGGGAFPGGAGGGSRGGAARGRQVAAEGSGTDRAVER